MTMRTARKISSSRHQLSQQAPEPDLARALDLVLELMAIPGTSGQEGRVAETIRRHLRKAGLAPSAMTTDESHRRTPSPGEVGNLICTLPGTLPLSRRLLMAHMDTVPLCVGSRPVLKGQHVRSANPASGLGADDRAGCAAILTAAIEILHRKLPHPPLTFFWPIQEETGLHGARLVGLARLRRPKLAFNWDGGPAGKLTVGATGAYRIAVEIQGLASHAGGAPEQGVSAVTIAGLAIAELERNGWLGDVRQGECRGTSNIGVIHGGAATNVVTDHVAVKAEVRSHDPAFRRRMLDAFERAFVEAAGGVRNVAGVTGSIKFTSRLDYEAFCLKENEPCVLAAEAAVRSAGGEPLRAISNGGLDANWLSARGIPTVTLGCGQESVHTTSERLIVAEFRQACRIALLLATASESA